MKKKKKELHLSKRNTIFRPTGTDVERDKRFMFIHYFIKSRIVVPFIKLADRFASKYIIKGREDIPKEVHNKNFFIIWDTFDEMLKEWWFTWKGLDRATTLPGKANKKLAKVLKRQWKEKERMHWYRVPKWILKLVITIALEDTAYREMINMYMFRLQGNMNKAYNPKIEHKFPLYVHKYDNSIPYFIEWAKMAGGGKMLIEIDADSNAAETKFVPAMIELAKMYGGRIVVDGGTAKPNVPQPQNKTLFVDKAKEKRNKKRKK